MAKLVSFDGPRTGLRTEGMNIFFYQPYHNLTHILLRDNRDKLRADRTDEFVLS